MRSLRPLAVLVLALWLSMAARPSRASEPDPPVMVAVPEPSPEAVRYHHTGNLLWIANLGVNLVVPALLLVGGIAAGLRDRVERLVRNRVGRVALYAVALILLLALADLPLNFYLGYVRPRAYGLSDRSLADWAADELKFLGVFLVIAVPVVVGLHALLARFPRTWWAWAGSATLPLLLFLAFVKPIWIDPLFDRFGPMRDRALEARILALARRAGIEGSRVFEVDKSHETNTVNAYVTGFLGTKRVVLWDTLTDRFDDDEVVAVMGHEMGHYVLNHVVAGLLMTTLLTFLGLFAVHHAARRVLRHRGGRIGVERLDDVAVLPLLLLLGYLVNLALIPVGFAFSRHLEHEADRFALELTRDNHAAASAFAGLVDTNLGYPRPGPFYTFWRATHPSLGDRIDFSNRYRPWANGGPIRYEGLFRDDGPTPE